MHGPKTVGDWIGLVNMSEMGESMRICEIRGKEREREKGGKMNERGRRIKNVELRIYPKERKE